VVNDSGQSVNDSGQNISTDYHDYMFEITTKYSKTVLGNI